MRDWSWQSPASLVALLLPASMLLPDHCKFWLCLASLVLGAILGFMGTMSGGIASRVLAGICSLLCLGLIAFGLLLWSVGPVLLG
jgi:hypothetical protein